MKLYINFRLPQKNVRTQWLKFATDNGISENYLNAKTIFFCSSHFPTTCFKTVKCRTRLQSNAVPSIMIKRKNKVSYVIKYKCVVLIL